MLLLKQIEDLFSQNYSLIRLFNSLHVKLFQISNGRLLGSVGNLPSLLLTTEGRRTGKPRTSALIFLEWENKYVIVTVNLPGLQLKANATVAEPAIRDLLWPKLLEFYPSFGEYEVLAGRTIPVVILDPSI